VDDLFDTFEDEEIVSKPKKYMTATLLQNVLKSDFKTIDDIHNIATTLDLLSFVTDVDSFSQKFKNLATAIHREYNLNFAMVEGLHRMYAVRNILEGKASEPFLQNVFMQSRIKTRLYILDEFTDKSLAGFQELSLFILKVKKASVDRTIYDEMVQIVNNLSNENNITDLTENLMFLGQAGQYNKDSNNIFYLQRLNIYTYILSFACNDKKSTILHKYQRNHVERVITSLKIPNKHQFLGVNKSVDLNDVNIFSISKTAVLKNIKKKAEDFVTLATRTTVRNNCWLTKGIANEIRILMSYYLLASISIKHLQAATSVFNPTTKFTTIQTNRKIDTMTTMNTIVLCIDSVVCGYLKAIGVTAQQAYMGKLEQLLQMNMLQDVLGVLVQIGHHPDIDTAILKYNNGGENEDSLFCELLREWSIIIMEYLQSECTQVLTEWNQKLMTVCKGKKTKTQVRQGRFGSLDMSDYTVVEKITFSFFIEQVEKKSFSAYSAKKNIQNDEEPKTESNAVDKSPPLFDDTDEEYTPTAPADDDETETVKCSTKRAASPVSSPDKKKAKISKRMFEVPGDVVTLYKSVIDREAKGIPVDIDISIIRQAWIDAVGMLKTSDDLKNLWNNHKTVLFEKLNQLSPKGNEVATARNEV